ncbi:MAG: hypothetical protein WA624_02265 [Methylocella sp.]
METARVGIVSAPKPMRSAKAFAGRAAPCKLASHAPMGGAFLALFVKRRDPLTKPPPEASFLTSRALTSTFASSSRGAR